MSASILQDKGGHEPYLAQSSRKVVECSVLGSERAVDAMLAE